MVCHVLNRANARLPLFECPADYELFEHTLQQAHQRVAMRTLAYCIMPNHWHLVLWPRADGDLAEFMRWLTVAHTQRWHAAHASAGTGHVYQGRYKMFPVQARRVSLAQRRQGVLDKGNSLWTVLRYVERNALRAGLAARAEQWRWGSLWRRTAGDAEQRALLTDPSAGWPGDWIRWVNRPQTEEEERAVAECIARGRPFGAPDWVAAAAARLGLQTTLHPRGRPRKSKENQEKGS
jgi:putative transposase